MKRRFERVEWRQTIMEKNVIAFTVKSALIELPVHMANIIIYHGSKERQAELLDQFNTAPLQAEAYQVELFLNFFPSGPKYGVIAVNDRAATIAGYNLDDYKDAFGLIKVFSHYYLCQSRWCVAHGAWLEKETTRLFIMGAKRAGKTSMAGHLVQTQGWRSVADDMFLFNLDSGQALPFSMSSTGIGIAGMQTRDGSFPAKDRLCIFLERDVTGTDTKIFSVRDGTLPMSFARNWDRSLSALNLSERERCKSKEAEMLQQLSGVYVRNLQGFGDAFRIISEGRGITSSIAEGSNLRFRRLRLPVRRA